MSSAPTPSANGTAAQPIIQIEKLSHTFGAGDVSQQVLTEIDLRVNPGELVIVTGASGCGKTTMLTLIGALRSVQKGSVQVLGRELRGLGKAELIAVRRNIGFIFQAHNFLEAVSAWANVNLALDLRSDAVDQLVQRGQELLTILQPAGPASAALAAVPRNRPSVTRALAASLLSILNLGDRVDYMPRELSGGQKQRVAIARALVNKPRLILADEPTAALDKASGETVIKLLKCLSRSGSAILVVTHDNRIMGQGDRIISMKDGRIASDIAVDQTTRICLFLQKVPLFSGLPPGRLVEVAERIKMETAPAGTRIIRQGDVGDKFYLINEGKVDVVLNEGTATEQVVATMTGGQFFGEVAIVEDKPRNATVIAKEPVQLYTLSKADFNAARAASDSMREELIKVYAQRRGRD